MALELGHSLFQTLAVNLKKYSDPLLALILAVAGIAHFLIPHKFLVAMPPYIPGPLLVIYVTGVIELIFAFLIMNPATRTKKITGQSLALYFVLLLPAHIHVSLNGIEMFGVSHKGLLWLRTLFQSVFIYWALQVGSFSIQDAEDQS